MAPSDLQALRRHLKALDHAALEGTLFQVCADLLVFVACTAAMARRVIAIEEASQQLFTVLPTDDPLIVQDARTVCESSARAVEQMAQVLEIVYEWLTAPSPNGTQAERAARSLLHSLNNVLVGITCYVELLSEELPAGDTSRHLLDVIAQEGAAVSQLVRHRAGVQRYLDELARARGNSAAELERDVLGLLLQTFGLRVSPSVRTTALVGDRPEATCALDALPPAERQAAREAIRRLADAEPNPEA